jgi:2-oxoisovalerate dehydrogenase E1 component
MMIENQALYRALYRIRRFEETVLDNFPKGVFHGTTHTYLGQEANAVGILSQIHDGDIVFSNHRCHGHYLAYGGDMRALFAEMMGKSTGVCGGRGGSQHLHWRNFYSNGVQGGILPIATGMSLAEKRKDTDALTVCFLGDGTLGQGIVYESLNMASLWGAPILYVVENNQIAQTTPMEMVFRGDIPGRFISFGISPVELDSSDVLEIYQAAGDLLEDIRAKRIPRALILLTHRFGPHSKGDDTRDQSEVAAIMETRDPLAIHAKRLAPEASVIIETEINSEVESAFKSALDDPHPEFSEESVVRSQQFTVSGRPNAVCSGRSTVLRSINEGLNRAMQSNERVILIGEDILDPYGGAFKITSGLSTAFPDRVISTPISEAGIVGVAAGMAARGLRPVVEIMFGDFLTLIADQIINHVAKFRWMYNEQVRVPLVVRTPMGGRRGYGPTHSQTLEKLFLGVPGLKVMAPCDLGNPGQLLCDAIWDDDPVLFIENKLLYLEKVQDESSLDDFNISQVSQRNGHPVYRLSVQGAPSPSITIATYGFMGTLARQAALELAYQDEVFVELIVLTQLSPFVLDPVISSVMQTGRILAIEEGTLSLGWGAEVIAQVTERTGDALIIARRVAARDTPVPSSGVLENAMLPGVDDIIAIAKTMVV